MADEPGKAGQAPAGGQTGGQAPLEGAGGQAPPAKDRSDGTPTGADRVADLEKRITAMQKDLAVAVKQKEDADAQAAAERVAKDESRKTADDQIADLKKEVRRAAWWAQLAQHFGNDEARIRSAMLHVGADETTFVDPAAESKPERVKVDALFEKYPHLKPAEKGVTLAGAGASNNGATLTGSDAELERAIQSNDEYAIWRVWLARTKRVESEHKALQPRMPGVPTRSI